MCTPRQPVLPNLAPSEIRGNHKHLIDEGECLLIYLTTNTANCELLPLVCMDNLSKMRENEGTSQHQTD